MPAEQKEIIDTYCLICYDIPASQSKLRKEVLRKMHDIGAMMFTASSYLVPYSLDSLSLANKIAEIGNATVFVSKQEDKNKAKHLTESYEDHLKIRCQNIEARLAMIKDHIQCGRLGKANRMAEKTTVLLNQLKQIAKTYNPNWLLPKVGYLEAKQWDLYNKPTE